jgi:hypothetical protein
VILIENINLWLIPGTAYHETILEILV